MENYIILGVLLAILGAVVLYLVRQKKKGAKCVGCPYARQCSSRCGNMRKG